MIHRAGLLALCKSSECSPQLIRALSLVSFNARAITACSVLPSVAAVVRGHGLHKPQQSDRGISLSSCLRQPVTDPSPRTDRRAMRHAVRCLKRSVLVLSFGRLRMRLRAQDVMSTAFEKGPDSILLLMDRGQLFQQVSHLASSVARLLGSSVLKTSRRSPRNLLYQQTIGLGEFSSSFLPHDVKYHFVQTWTCST